MTCNGRDSFACSQASSIFHCAIQSKLAAFCEAILSVFLVNVSSLFLGRWKLDAFKYVPKPQILSFLQHWCEGQSQTGRPLRPYSKNLTDLTLFLI